MKNITLSADEGLIEEARRVAAARGTTLNAEFRLWLADYVGRKREGERAIAAMNSVAEVIDAGGRRFIRDEMNERQQIAAAKWLVDAGGSAPDLEDIPRRRSAFGG